MQLLVNNSASGYVQDLDQGNSPLLAAVKEAYWDCAKILLPVSDVDARDKTEGRAIHYVVANVGGREGEGETLQGSTRFQVRACEP